MGVGEGKVPLLDLQCISLQSESVRKPSRCRNEVVSEIRGRCFQKCECGAWTDRQTGRQTDRQTDRQIDRQTDSSFYIKSGATYKCLTVSIIMIRHHDFPLLVVVLVLSNRTYFTYLLGHKDTILTYTVKQRGYDLVFLDIPTLTLQQN